MTCLGSSVIDSSLVSDVSDIGELGTFTLEHYGTPTEFKEVSQLTEPFSPLISELSSPALPQVRFSPRSSASPRGRSLSQTNGSACSQEFTYWNSDDGTDLTSVTYVIGSQNKNTMGNQSSGSMVDRLCPIRVTRLTNGGAPDDKLYTSDPYSNDTSLWVDSVGSQHASTELGSRDRNAAFRGNAKLNTCLRTADHMPRPPLRRNLFSIPVPSSITKSDEDNHSTSCSPRTRPHSTSSTESLSLSSVCDSSSGETIWPTVQPQVAEPGMDTVDLSKPQIHSAYALAKDIHILKDRIEKESHSGPSKEIRQKACELVDQACGVSNTNNDAQGFIPNPGLTVNIPENVYTFTNLVDLSVDQSEIYRQERQRIMKQRRDMALLNKRAAKAKQELPPADPMEFFDPNRHIFQSINLHHRGLPSFLPRLKRASDSLATIFHDRLVSDFCRLHT